MKTSDRRSAWSFRSAMVSGGLTLLMGTQALAAEPVSLWSRLTAGNTQVTCFGSNRTVFTPPLSDVPQPGAMHHTSRYSCLSVYGPSASSASVATVTVNYAGYTCDELLSSAPEHFTVVWNNGEQSELVLAPAEVDTQETTTTVTYSGVVVDGKFKGVEAVRSWSFLNTDLSRRCRSADGLPETNMFAIFVLARLTPPPR